MSGENKAEISILPSSGITSLRTDGVNWIAVGPDADGQRVDNYLARVAKGVPKSHIYRIIRAGEVRVNEVSFGIEAYDRMTGTTNKYGVHQVDLYIDDSLFFSTYIYRYSFDETRYINSFAEEGVIMRTYIAPGNRLKSIYKQVENRGILHVDA